VTQQAHHLRLSEEQGRKRESRVCVSALAQREFDDIQELRQRLERSWSAGLNYFWLTTHGSTTARSAVHSSVCGHCCSLTMSVHPITRWCTRLVGDKMTTRGGLVNRLLFTFFPENV
jgi:hypothetical protein